ncbi:MAG: glutamate--tRNA ligase family protein [Saprospiraceae bacterium]
MDSFSQQFFDFSRTVTSESRLRLAPTPSGFIHRGNALNFVLNWLAAKSSMLYAPDIAPAKIFLRIDDLDSDRNRPEYVQDIFDSLEWLKLTWDSDLYQSTNLPAIAIPKAGHPSPTYQSSNLLRYSKILEMLREQNLLFACRKSRRDLEQYDNVYPPEFREQGLSLDDPDVAWRIKTPANFPLPDFVVRRRDGIPAYQVASFADDLHYGITHIIRGADLEDSTTAQCFLAKVLSEDNFLKIRFLHHPLLLDEAGEKLSKSAGSSSLKAIRDAGMDPENVFQMIGKWLGLIGDSAFELLDSMRERLV